MTNWVLLWSVPVGVALTEIALSGCSRLFKGDRVQSITQELKEFQQAQTDDARQALLLRAGALAAPLDFVEERSIGPSLGKDNIELGLRSMMIGSLLVMGFMLLVYRVFGIFANVALVFNVALLLSVMSMLSATLTLPGMAGIVLTVGMAVDANVLINSRIREELENGLSPYAAIQAGYDRAWLTILDSNLTTMLIALILLAIGTGPVRGFAVVLTIGILTSMFTAVSVSRLLVELVYGRRRISKLSI